MKYKAFSKFTSGKFLPDYIERQILAFDPFIHLDQQGVGNLIRMALEQSRKVQKKMEYGIWNMEHAGIMAVIRDRSSSSTGLVSTMFPAVPIWCPSLV